ncbi:hypothetical protein BpHYR1_033512 [Brachionus plicatilis]|uniref:Uncharacterized protein n=1 Tax=Brachionus plicatilis TaxID=10195 RepID=A0A3M7QXA9_BRAPC|nr:hypothetical protein BpHYR1_033512 [Brachionus plicatilis]
MSYGGLSHQTKTHIGNAIVAFSDYSSNCCDVLISSTIFLNKFFELALTTSGGSLFQLSTTLLSMKCSRWLILVSCLDILC